MLQRLPLIDLITLPEQAHSHHHEHSQVVVGLEGVSLMEVNGEPRQILPGQGCAVDAFLPHQYAALSDDSRILVLNQPGVASSLGDTHSPAFFQLDAQVQQLIAMLLAQTRSDPSDAILLQTCQQTMLTLVARRSQTFERQFRESKLDISVIEAYVRRHLGSKLTVPQLAALVFLSDSQFYTRFKQQMGITPAHYVSQLRIEEVKQCLLLTDLPLSQIAQQCGYSSQSAMTNSFKKAVGVTPAKFQSLIPTPANKLP
ncbi:helix-turn-helix transcriptional regulator [Vibrio ulleungensis]|uniref:Helix-turn-helix domain-containing protein n=1 Tax=Vibrio ulleungensis TaxID=2807619 RepID=A0ABS2HFU6_9VIBR|nr:AraC family transcriptional regulator [Vibrio ulleungensis]MBM7034952.1 helix-turn-helix domain-containing protein [Vibrio ulleungensis]